VRENGFEWLGGDVAIDFQNTVSWRREGLLEERLRSYADVVAWGRGAGLIVRPDALLARALRRPTEAARALRHALGLRATIHAIFTAIACRRAPETRALSALNRVLSGALGRLAVGKRPKGYDWTWTDTNRLDSLCGPIVWSAARLLTSDEVGQVGRCANENCGWLFVDRSRRHNRRWCEMSECGSRDKARRYYARKRARRRRPESGSRA
jgi:predicted RNA-binding Zn ribbon-like protein